MMLSELRTSATVMQVREIYSCLSSSLPSDGQSHVGASAWWRIVSGRKNSQSLPLIYQLASQGWVCISANYRLSPAARFPDHLIDAKKVIAWVREHGFEYGADPTTIFLAGNSAGGHMAAMAALTPNDPNSSQVSRVWTRRSLPSFVNAAITAISTKNRGHRHPHWHTAEKTHRRSSWHMVIRTGKCPWKMPDYSLSICAIPQLIQLFTSNFLVRSTILIYFIPYVPKQSCTVSKPSLPGGWSIINIINNVVKMSKSKHLQQSGSILKQG